MFYQHAGGNGGSVGSHCHAAAVVEIIVSKEIQ